MHIVLSGSAEYLSYAPVLLRSVVDSNPDSIISFHIFHFLPNEVVSQLKHNLEKACLVHPRASLFFHPVSDEDVKLLDSSKGWNPALWARWKSLDILRDLTDRFLVLGIDTLVRRNISDFYFQDLDNNIFCASPDGWISTSDLSGWAPYSEMESFNVSPKNYINADVVLVNLLPSDSPTFSEFLSLYADINTSCLDQDVINYCFASRLKLAPSYFNYFPNILSDSLKDRHQFAESSIVQFAGAPKPWNLLGLKSYSCVGHREWWTIAHCIGIHRRHLIFDRITRRLKTLLTVIFP